MLVFLYFIMQILSAPCVTGFTECHLSDCLLVIMEGIITANQYHAKFVDTLSLSISLFLVITDWLCRWWTFKEQDIQTQGLISMMSPLDGCLTVILQFYSLCPDIRMSDCCCLYHLLLSYDVSLNGAHHAHNIMCLVAFLPLSAYNSRAVSVAPSLHIGVSGRWHFL